MLRRVVGNSMSPTFRDGQYVFGFRTKKVHVGDVVIAMQNGREVIKRISMIDGKSIWLHGDNASASTDSRTHGAAQINDVLAKIVWPKNLANN